MKNSKDLTVKERKLLARLADLLLDMWLQERTMESMDTQEPPQTYAERRR